MRTSSVVWQRQQYLSHSHWDSGISHCAQRYLAWPVPVDIEEMLAPGGWTGNVPLVTWMPAGQCMLPFDFDSLRPYL